MKIIIILFFFICNSLVAQFQFSGNVNNDFSNATAYLSIVNDCNKKSLFLTEHILQESNIDENLQFSFNGDFLATENQIYKIHIDNCNDNISDYKHLLNHCEFSKEILFIANNTDKIIFPLNDLSQVFCSIEQSNSYSNSIYKIEQLQEQLLNNLQQKKSDFQRKNTYKNHFTSLQKFSKTFNEPLAELYTFYLYANDNSLSNEYYLTHLKKSDYYNDLLNRLENKYPNSNYTKLYKSALIKDQYPLLQTKSVFFRKLALAFGLLLLLSLGYNLFQFLKAKKEIVITKSIDYKTILTAQEQKVFELMQGNSNKEIAEKLFVSLSTIKSHINTIYSKLQIGSRKEIERFFS